MELMQEVKGYSDHSKEEEEEEEEAITGEDSCRLHQQEGGSNLANHGEGKQQQHRVDHMMELSLGRNRGEVVQEEGSASCSCSINTLRKKEEVEKEHMFEKVVTPSDVGKLNRLVIPKQYAEKYFPLDSSSNEKGLLLNFEDRNGKVWRFRYSYWNSSQSYVMTKGWSRFVKEKKLDAGDIVSFHRGIGDLYRHRLYIDWRRRPHNFPSNSSLLAVPFLPNNNHFHPITTGARLYPFPSTSTTQYVPRYPPPPPPPHLHNLHCNNNNFYTLHQHQYHAHDHLNSLYYLTSPTPPDQYFPPQQQDRGNINNVPMIIDSVPVAHPHRGGGVAAVASRPGSNTTTTTTTGKRLRLFGVNMECASSVPPMPNSSLQRMGLPREDPLSSSARFGDQRGATTSDVLFDLDPTSQYRLQ